MKNLKVQYISGDKAWCFCTHHEDIKRPNLSITLSDKYYGCYKCWACGKYGKLSTTQMKTLNLNEPVHIDRKKVMYRWSKLARDYKNKLDSLPLIKLGLANELNINVSTLSQWDVGYDGQAFTIPMFSNGTYNGIQRRFPNGGKCCVEGSKLGIMMSNEEYYPGDTLFICEGFSDAISVHDLVFTAIARPNCHFTDMLDFLTDDDDEYDDEEYYDIIIIPDNDKVGLDGAKELRQHLDYNIVGDIRIFEFKGADDIRDYIALKGKEEVYKELMRF